MCFILYFLETTIPLFISCEEVCFSSSVALRSQGMIVVPVAKLNLCKGWSVVFSDSSTDVVSFIQDTILCLEMEEERAPGDPAGEALLLVGEVKARVRTKPLTPSTYRNI